MKFRRHHLRTSRLLVTAAVGAVVLAGCSSPDDSDDADASPSASPTEVPSSAEPAPKPRVGTCHRMSFEDALAPTTDASNVKCAKPHTTESYAVGDLETVIDGHLLAIDSDRVQQQPARQCPPKLTKFLGGDLDDLRTSMLRPVWFTPTVEESDAGAAWYRCDVIAVAGSNKLARVEGSLKGVLNSDKGNRYGMCGTAAPDAKDFKRVQCGSKHSWKAIEVVPFKDGKFPGAAAVGERKEECIDAARDVADDPLDFQWSYEPPSKDSWNAGQTYGLCWAPD